VSVAPFVVRRAAFRNGTPNSILIAARNRIPHYLPLLAALSCTSATSDNPANRNIDGACHRALSHLSPPVPPTTSCFPSSLTARYPQFDATTLLATSLAGPAKLKHGDIEN